MANITGNQIKQLIINYRDNLGGANDEQILGWINFLNNFFYNKIVNVNPNDFLKVRTIKTIADQSTYTLPSDFKTLQYGAIFDTVSGTEFGTINFDAETVAFTTIGQTITSSSGAFGTLVETVDFGTTGTLRLSNVDTTAGEFGDNETLTGSTEGSATSNGSLIAFKFTDKGIPETGFGSNQLGFWIDLTSFNFTPLPSQSRVYSARYLPLLTKLTAFTEETLIPTPDYDEFVRNSIDVFWNQWRVDTIGEENSTDRSTQALGELLTTIRKTTGVFGMPDQSRIYTRSHGHHHHHK